MDGPSMIGDGMAETEQNAGRAESGQPAVDERELLRWRSIPARRSWKVSLLVVFTILGLPVLLAIWYGPFFGLLGLVILGASLMPFFLPTDFILTESSVQRRYLGIDHTRKWSEFRSYYPDKNGVLLSPFPRPSRLENFRGLYIRFEDNRERVLAVIKDKVAGEQAKESS
jgi:hypothetical protein